MKRIAGKGSRVLPKRDVLRDLSQGKQRLIDYSKAVRSADPDEPVAAVMGNILRK